MASPSMALEQPGQPQEIDFSPDNPQLMEPEQQLRDLGISEEDKQLLVKTITEYRTGWSPDRMLRLPNWMRSNLFYRGIQCLAWDPGSQTYFDVIAWNQQQGKDVSYIQQYVNNITQMLGTSYVGIMSAGIPSTTVKPENAEILADVTTAKAGQEAIAIIERMNKHRQMIRKENLLLYLYGVYFKRTYISMDGEWCGYDEEPIFGDIPQTLPERYHCSMCGTDTPLAGMGEADKSCPKCQNALGPADFYPEEQTTEWGITGMQKVPRAMVRWGVHGPLEIDVDPEANGLGETPLLAFDREIDIGTARKTFPKIAEEIKEGQELSTTPSASYERQRRTEAYSKSGASTADAARQKITFSQNWLQPDAYYRLGDGTRDANGMTFAERMMEVAPEGLMLSMLGDRVVSIRKALLTKEWSCCLLHENCGMYPPSIAENVVPFNQRFNEITDMIDDWLNRCAAGLVIYDARKFDKKQMNGMQFTAGTMNPVQVNGASDKPLSAAIHQFQFSIDQHAFNWPGMILQFCYLISGLQPQTFGAGTQEKVDTLGGQKLQLQMANTRLNINFEQVKEEHADAGLNAIYMLQQAKKLGLIDELWSVVEANGSEFRNNYVDLEKMDGRVRVDTDEDQGLPQAPEQLRTMFVEMLKEMANGNPIVAEMLDVETNQELILSTVAPGLIRPGEAQKSRTLQHVNVLLEKDWVVGMDQTGQPARDLPVKPERQVEDFITAKKVIKRFRQENGDLAASNPEGWARIDAYYSLLEELEVQDAMQEAQRKARVAQSSAPGPDPQIQQAKQQLLSDAAAVAQAATALATAPPLPKGVGTTNVSAAKVIIDAATKSVQ